MRRRCKDLNTSNVNVNQTFEQQVKYNKAYLNTSNVNVNLIGHPFNVFGPG